MTQNQQLTKLIQSHYALEYFNYDLAVGWAIDLIHAGIETKNILILASFSKPTITNEIRSYVDAALNDLKVEIMHGDEAVHCRIEYYLDQIINRSKVREMLKGIYHLFCSTNGYQEDRYDLDVFYQLDHAWDDLEAYGQNFYFEEANLDNIVELVVRQASHWKSEMNLKTHG